MAIKLQLYYRRIQEKRNEISNLKKIFAQMTPAFVCSVDSSSRHV